MAIYYKVPVIMIKQLSAGTISTTPRKFYSLQSDYSMHHSKVKTKKYSNSKRSCQVASPANSDFPLVLKATGAQQATVKSSKQQICQSKFTRPDPEQSTTARPANCSAHSYSSKHHLTEI